MIGTAPLFPAPSSRRATVGTARLRAHEMGIDLGDRQAPGLAGAILILAAISLFVGGFFYGAADQACDWVIRTLLR